MSPNAPYEAIKPTNSALKTENESYWPGIIQKKFWERITRIACCFGRGTGFAAGSNTFIVGYEVTYQEYQKVRCVFISCMDTLETEEICDPVSNPFWKEIDRKALKETVYANVPPIPKPENWPTDLGYPGEKGI